MNLSNPWMVNNHYTYLTKQLKTISSTVILSGVKLAVSSKCSVELSL